MVAHTGIKTMEKDAEPKTTDPWTDKQLSTMRQNCVTIALEARKVNPGIDILEFAIVLFDYIKDGKVPEHISLGGCGS